jgi:hypothetical protein
MWAVTSLTASVYQLAITPLDGHTATQIYTVSGAKWSGGSASGDYLPSAAMVVSLRTSERGRQNRGRLFIPMVTETAVSNGSITASLTACQAAWDTFRANMTTALMPMHVASYGHSLHKHKNPDGSITYTPVTWAAHSNAVVSSAVETVLGTMRPRQSRLR